MSRVSTTKAVQAPVGGINARDALAAMKETDAVEMENMFPTPSSVDLRNGYQSHVTGFSDPVETLISYNTGAVKKLFAVSGGDIFDVTTAGAVGSAVVTGLTNSRLQHCTMSTAGGFFSMMVNGEDKLQYYTGSAWHKDGGGTYAITGVDTSDCVNINNFKNRIFLIEKESFNAWYLPVSSIAGTASKLTLGGLFKLGGYLVSMANWTIDNAAGIDDYAAFITSEGEVALYKGTNPSDADAWALVGTFTMGRPIGYRCTCKAGADVLVLTSDGAMPLSKALLTDRSKLSLAATDKISKLISSDVNESKGKFGWQAIIYPLGQKLIINIPETENTVSHQYVMNTTSQAWTKFTGWNAICFSTFDDNLYFGGADSVCLADYGNSDDGENISAFCQQAFSTFGRGTQKVVKLVQPIIGSDSVISPSIVVNFDFDNKKPSYAIAIDSGAGSVWDDCDWDDCEWGGGNQIKKTMLGASGIGTYVGVCLSVSAKNIEFNWMSTNFHYEAGNAF